MSMTLINVHTRWIARRYMPAAGVLLATLLALSAAAQRAGAQPPAGPTQVAAAEKVGVTLYQAGGLSGKIPLKKVQVADPSGDTSHYELQFASGNMNTKMDFEVKFVLPSGMVFTSLEVSTTNGNVNVTPASADSWDGQTMIDKVTVSPWNMNSVLQQCVDHLKQADGSFKDSATFDLQADITQFVRGKGICKFPNAPPGSAMSDTAKVKPRTRVTAYIVEESRIGSGSRQEQRLSSDRPARQSSGQSSRLAPGRDLDCRGPNCRDLNGRDFNGRDFNGRDLNGAGSASKPQSAVPRRTTSSPSSSAIKDRFERSKLGVPVP